MSSDVRQIRGQPGLPWSGKVIPKEAPMFTATVMTMRDLGPEEAELLPAWETLC